MPKQLGTPTDRLIDQLERRLQTAWLEAGSDFRHCAGAMLETVAGAIESYAGVTDEEVPPVLLRAIEKYISHDPPETDEGQEIEPETVDLSVFGEPETYEEEAERLGAVLSERQLDRYRYLRRHEFKKLDALDLARSGVAVPEFSLPEIPAALCGLQDR
jgi:hypothetical protein